MLTRAENLLSKISTPSQCAVAETEYIRTVSKRKYRTDFLKSHNELVVVDRTFNVVLPSFINHISLGREDLKENATTLQQPGECVMTPLTQLVGKPVFTLSNALLFLGAVYSPFSWHVAT